MTGDLTHQRHPLLVTFEVTFINIFPDGQLDALRLYSVGSISRSAFGVSYAVPLVSDEVTLTLDVQFILPKADA